MKEGARDAGDGFLSRWSRLKREAERPEPPLEPATAPEAEAEATPEPEALSEDDLAALPRLEDFTETTDLSGFLRPGVPPALKNAALRRMWMLSPAIRDYRDPAVDYAWDWNTPGGVPGDGCAPSAEAVARMLKDLVSPRETPQDAPKAEPTESKVPSAALETEAPFREPPFEPPASPDGVEAAFQASNETLATVKGAPAITTARHDATPIEARATTLPRKRHGGAMPT